MHALGPRQALAHAGRQGGNGRIASARNIGYFTHCGAAVHRRFTGAEQRHTLGAARHQQPLNTVAVAQLGSKGFATGPVKLCAGLKPASHVKFTSVGGHTMRTSIALPVAALGVDQHGNAQTARFINDNAAQVDAVGRLKQHTLGVVG